MRWEVPHDLVQRLTEVLQDTVASCPPDRLTTVALSGGTTPQAAFQAWASPAYHDAVPWERLRLFWGDERPVPPESPDSNFGNAKRLWLRHGHVPSDQIHPWATDRPPADATRDYASLVSQYVASGPGGVPQFDLVLLGVGPEGHTASLFPNSPAFDAEGWTAAPFVPELGTLRFTLTPSVLTSARQVVFLAEGTGKRDIIARILEGPDAGTTLPAQYVARLSHSLWLLDAAAAAGLSPAEPGSTP